MVQKVYAPAVHCGSSSPTFAYLRRASRGCRFDTGQLVSHVRTNKNVNGTWEHYVKVSARPLPTATAGRSPVVTTIPKCDPAVSYLLLSPSLFTGGVKQSALSNHTRPSLTWTIARSDHGNFFALHTKEHKQRRRIAERRMKQEMERHAHLHLWLYHEPDSAQRVGSRLHPPVHLVLAHVRVTQAYDSSADLVYPCLACVC